MTDETDPGAPPAPTMDKLTRVYIKIRDARAALARKFEEEDEALKAQLAQVSSVMKDIIRAAGGTGMKTQYGTVSLKTSTRFYAQDWDAMYQFMKDHDAPYLLEKRIAQRNMADFLEQNPGVVPPGLNSVSEIDVSVTKPRK